MNLGMVRSEIIRVMSKSNERVARVRFEITSMISDQNCSPLRSITIMNCTTRGQIT